MKKTLLLLCIFNALAASAHVTALTGLSVEGRVTPLGLDERIPRFGWKIVSSKKNVVQRAYRLLVASSLDKLSHNTGDVWDSQTVYSDSSQWVGYKGQSLRPNTNYYWKVQVVTNKGKTDWSTPAKWSTGLLSPENWHGQWLGLDSLGPDDSMKKHSRLATRYFRKTFKTKGTVKRAVMHISGLGLYTLFINGKRIGNNVLTPLPTDYTKTVVYNTYDVTPQIHKDNAIGVMLAAGHYFAQRQNYQTNVCTTYGFPRLKANLIIEYDDGSSQTISTDSSWRLCTDGAIRYANEYDGELFDARRLFDRWTLPGFDDSKWMQAQPVTEPGGIMCGNLSPEMSVYLNESPVAVKRYGNRLIVDFGTNGAGRIRLHLKGQVGDTIRIRHAELLSKGDSLLYTENLRSAEATARYVSDGREREWTPEFTFYGFRYAEITGAPDLKAKDIRRELIADKMNDEGNTFYAEDEHGESLLNTIVANALRSIRSNYKGIPLDCPQRDERMPWLGDRTTGCIGESFLLDNHSFYAKWARDIRDSQRDDGNISDVAPAYWRLYTGNVTWPAALPFACDMLYRQYGDLRPMRNSFASIKKFLSFIRNNRYKNGLVIADRYGDWCVPPESPKLIHSKDPARKTSGVLIASAYYAYLCRMMSHYAPLTGNERDAEYYNNEAKAVETAFLKEYFHNGTFSNSTVTANLLPLAMNMVPAEAVTAVTDTLIHTIKVKNNSHVSSGVIGIQWLMRELSDTGNGELAYQLATTKTYPGWGYMVSKGATTIWELWNGDTANPKMNSGNHVMLLGDLLLWCFERLGGIRTDDARTGFKHIILKPDFNVNSLKTVRATHNTPYGLVSCEWKRNNGRLHLTVTVPPNTTAEVYTKQGDTKKIGSGTYTFNWKE